MALNLAEEQKLRNKKREQEEIDKLANDLETLAEDQDLIAGLDELDKQE